MSFLGDDTSIGPSSVIIVPKAGANYTDTKTVGAVQAALRDKGYSPGTIDGILGPNTKKAIKALQSDMGYDQTGIIDENIIRVLQVTPGVLPPGVTLREKSLLNAQVALDKATAAEHSATPSDVQDAAQAATDAANATDVPPEVKAAVAAASSAARAARTSAQIQAAATQVKDAAQRVHSAIAYTWWTTPLWSNAPITRGEVIVGGGVIALLTTVMIVALRRK